MDITFIDLTAEYGRLRNTESFNLLCGHDHATDLHHRLITLVVDLPIPITPSNTHFSSPYFSSE